MHIQFNLWSVYYDLLLYDGTWCQFFRDGCQEGGLHVSKERRGYQEGWDEKTKRGR